MWTKELRRHKGRTAATAAAVGTAMALLVSMLAISEGIIGTVEAQIRDSGADLLVGAPYDTNFDGARSLAGQIGAWDEVEFATPALQALVSVSSGNPGTAPVTPAALGVIPGPFYKILPPADQALFDGWFSGGGDPLFEGNYTSGHTHEVVLSKEVARALGVGRGDAVQVARAPSTPAEAFTVVGVADTALSPERVIQDAKVAFFRLSELQLVVGEAFTEGSNGTEVADRASRIYVALGAAARLDPDGARTVKARIEGAFPDFAGMVSTRGDRLVRLQDEYAVARLFYTAIGFVSLVIGLLFVACIVMISVSERTRDIGALRAIGVSRRSIFTMVLAEAVALVSLGAAAGVAPAYLGARALGNLLAASQGVAATFIDFGPALIAVSVAEVVLFGAAASLYPAWRATRVPVVEALQARG